MGFSALLADISSNNAQFNAPAYRKAGHIAVAIKATEGVTYVNPDHRQWTLHAQWEHLSVIHYHFARPDLNNNPTVEAEHFLAVALPNAGGRDFLALDLERATPAGWKHDPAWSKQFTATVRSVSRFHPILYASRATLQIADQADAWLAGDLLRFWDADWSRSPDWCPKGGQVALRQQSGLTAGVPPFELPGIGACDVDVARGIFWRQLLTNMG